VTVTLTVSSTTTSLSQDVNISVDKNSSSGSTISTGSFSTTGSGELLLAFIASDSTGGNNVTVNSMTGGGLTWALVRRTNVQRGTAEIWRAFATATLTNVTVSATLSQAVTAS